MDIHAVEAEAAWKNAGGKPADLEALRDQFGPEVSFAELASHRDLADMEALQAFGGGGVAAATMVADVVETEPAVKPKPAAKAPAKPKAKTRKK